MTGNRGRRSRLQVWVAVPITGLVVGAGLAALTAQGLDDARSEGRRGRRRPPERGRGPVADALRVRADDGGRPTLLQPQALVSPLASAPPTSVMVESVLSIPVWSGSSEVGFVAAPAPAPAPVAVVTMPPPAPPAGPSAPPPASQPPVVIDPPVVVDPPVVPEEPVGEVPPADTVEGTVTEPGTTGTSEPVPPGTLIETAS